MNHSELIAKVAATTELNQAAAGRTVKALVATMLDALTAGTPIRVAGLGVFEVAARRAHNGRNPRTGEVITVAASNAVRFRPAKVVKEAVNPPPPQRGRRAAPPKRPPQRT